MEITEVRIKLVERSSERLRAFCSVTLDGDFVIRDLKIIDGTNGVFVAMPSRKLADRCPRCGSKNHLRAKHCNDCGARLNENRAPKDAQGRAKLHADVAHPINAACRERIQKAVVETFNAELERSKSPDYRPAKYDDFEVDLDDEAAHTKPAVAEAPKLPASRQPEPERKPEAEPAGIAEPPEQQEEFGDYNSLIAELKRDAANRRERHEEQRPVRNSAPPPPPEQPQRGGGGPRPDRGGRDRRGQGGQGRDRGGNRSSGERPPQTQPERPASPPPPPRAPEPSAPPPLPRAPEESPPPQPPAPPADDDFGAGL